jgi:hypothetical protein
VCWAKVLEISSTLQIAKEARERLAAES